MRSIYEATILPAKPAEENMMYSRLSSDTP